MPGVLPFLVTEHCCQSCPGQHSPFLRPCRQLCLPLPGILAFPEGLLESPHIHVLFITG